MLFDIFKKEKKPQPILYDRERQRPVIRASICTGERTLGFQDLTSKKFIEYALVRSEKDIEDFQSACQAEEIETIY